MRAIVVDEWMDASKLRVSEVPDPEAVEGTVLVDVKAAGCNFADSILVAGKYQYQPPFPFVPGSEVAGVVAAVGAGVAGFEIGDRVFAACGLGGYAEKTLVPGVLCHAMPEGMSFAEATALALVYPTSYAGLVFRADLQAGETLLVHAAAGGVGIAAVQIGKALGARVIASAGSAQKCEVARNAGADHAIDYEREDFVARVREITDGKGADVIYDPVGGEVTDKSLKCIAWNGRLLIIGYTSGTIPEIKVNRILLKNIAVTGLNWDAYGEVEPKKVAQTFDSLADLYARGAITPVVWKIFALAEVPAALAALGTRATYGKVVVRP